MIIAATPVLDGCAESDTDRVNLRSPGDTTGAGRRGNSNELFFNGPGGPPSAGSSNGSSNAPEPEPSDDPERPPQPIAELEEENPDPAEVTSEPGRVNWQGDKAGAEHRRPAAGEFDEHACKVVSGGYTCNTGGGFGVLMASVDSGTSMPGYVSVLISDDVEAWRDGEKLHIMNTRESPIQVVVRLRPSDHASQNDSETAGIRIDSGYGPINADVDYTKTQVYGKDINIPDGLLDEYKDFYIMIPPNCQVNESNLTKICLPNTVAPVDRAIRNQLEWWARVASEYEAGMGRMKGNTPDQRWKSPLNPKAIGDEIEADLKRRDQQFIDSMKAANGVFGM